MSVLWARIRSWHIVRADGRTPCGRVPEGPLADIRPATEKTCESCLRWLAKEVDE